jgi:hypothetical protein
MLMSAAERGWPTMVARIGVMRALNAGKSAKRTSTPACSILLTKLDSVLMIHA